MKLRAEIRSPFTKGSAIVIMTAVSCSLPVNAIAQSNMSMDAVETCLSDPDPVSRLQCYDTVLGFSQPEQNVPVQNRSVDAPPVIELDRNMPENSVSEETTDSLAANILTRPIQTESDRKRIETAKAEQPSSISVPIRKIDTFGYKKSRFFLANGQVWDQVDSMQVRPPKLSRGRVYTAEIREAAFNSFLLQIDGKGRAIRVKRVR